MIDDLTMQLRNILLEGRGSYPGCLPFSNRTGPHAAFMDEGDLAWMMDSGYLDTDGDFDYIAAYHGNNNLMQAKITWLWMKEV